MEILIQVKPSSHRDMVKHALRVAGWTITGSGYALDTDTGDLISIPPSGASISEFGPAMVDLPPNPEPPGRET